MERNSPLAGPDGPDPVRDVVIDAKGLRALAHPLRVQLVGQLRKDGPGTATQLARRLGVNSGTASYHLRQLDAAGFVEEDTSRGNARERWWRARHQSTWFPHAELADQEPEATLSYLQSIAATDNVRTHRVLSELATMPRAWRDVLDLSDWPLLLTPEESQRLRDELRAVIARYRRAPTSEASAPAGRVPPGAERVSLAMHLLPELDARSDVRDEPAAPYGPGVPSEPAQSKPTEPDAPSTDRPSESTT
ncbi:winged helix-turn-helix domain-containing protein [Streptomyces oceani]|uniref:ArsR family transcriptional regulator n=1 Tax=Streptomyces oceani TaxID=1075402 RepID=A0A1E7JX80_9ACTN|nr:helix-turn-helix domain-containing protein [Streptomyces oceani]OEU96275.1 ArsR family transcriptional regulator [Streptomyces oceani]